MAMTRAICDTPFETGFASPHCIISTLFES
jgi:hypothetical protein